MSGIGHGGTGVLKVDGKEVATQKMEHTIPFILQWDETFDIGSDTGTPVDDEDYQPPFTFTGKLEQAHADDRPAEADARGHQEAGGGDEEGGGRQGVALGRRSAPTVGRPPIECSARVS